MPVLNEAEGQKFNVLEIGIAKPQGELKKLIKKRLLKRLKQGLVAEVRKLKKSGLSFKRLEEFGLEYRFVAQYLQKKMSHQEMIVKLQKETEHLVKKQMTWFNKNHRIKWVKNYKESEELVKNFLSN